ncbi:MAG TPA: TPM domain-containing protein [Gammaproteobacteria bacterium]
MNVRKLVAILPATIAGALLIIGPADIARILRNDERPSPAMLVDDRAMLLSESQREHVGRYHEALRQAHDIDYRVLVLADGGDIDQRAHRYFSEAGVGSQSATGRGLLLVVDTAQDRVRLEVSTSLEGVYTDAFVAYVQNRQLVPFFAAGRVADGVVATTELIVARAREAATGKAFAPPMAPRSMGGGAAATAAIGTAEDPAAAYKQQAREVDVAGATPLEVVEAYLEAMAARDARTDLPIYSADTRRMLRNRVVTAAQMDTVARLYRKCRAEGVHMQADLAVVRYDVAQRECAPYFLRREEGEWRLDLAAASAALRFNHENHWRFDVPVTHEYRFAFEDWRIDGNGVPRAARAR